MTQEDGESLATAQESMKKGLHHNKNIFKGVTLHLSARIIAWSPAPAEIE
jgi:hypothetical protein